MATWQWYYTIPWTILYSWKCLTLRNHTKKQERVKPLKRPIVHWVILGIIIIAVQLNPVDLERIYSIDLVFIIFTLFLADSYWDFQKD